MGASFVDVMRVVTTVSALYMCASPSSAVYRMHKRRDVGNVSLLPFATLWVCNHIWYEHPIDQKVVSEPALPHF